MITEEEFENDLSELSSAEDFLDYFGLEYETSVVNVNRLHILQRYGKYLEKSEGTMPDNMKEKMEAYAQLLQQAYEDFVKSDALTEKVFKVFHLHQPKPIFVSLGSIAK